MQENEAIPTLRLSSPDALRPHITIGPPGEPIALYSGPIDFIQDVHRFSADGHVCLAWLPTPQVRFEVPHLPNGVHPELDGLSLQLDDGTAISRGQVTAHRIGCSASCHSASLSGIVKESVVRPADGSVTHVLFLLPNFPFLIGKSVQYPEGSVRLSRLTLRSDGWIITLDAVADQKAVEESLSTHSGFGITHVGRLEREAGTPFAAAEALPVLDALACYGSFAAGRWTGPCLPTGFDAVGKQVWQIWDYSRTTPFRTCDSWLDSNHGEQFEDPFPGFMRLWLDKDWNDVIRTAIHWYVEANAQSGSIEGSIVLTQTAFELLVSSVLVEHHGWLSTGGHDNLAAADRIRLLFLWAGIPTAVPAELADLGRQAKADNWPDTTTAMTMIRNTITHPTKKNREKFGKHLVGARTDAWRLGLWGLELCLLRLFEYRGTYGNRIKPHWVGETETVPWAL